MMSKSIFLNSVVVGLFILFPTVAEGAVIINEIAWMGGVDSANDEWIELYNNGGNTVSVDGWVLSDGQSVNVTLAGAVGAGQHVILERTDDNSAPGTAFVIYTGALSNAGGTLTLRDASGALVDQVAGGEDWHTIGGDNATKETAQYTTNGWVTAIATPGSANTTESNISEDGTHTEDVSTKKYSSTGSVAARKYVSEPTLVKSTAELALTVAMPERVFVNQPVTFKVTPKNLGKTISNSLTYTWNFGDLSVGAGEEVQHTYTHPGEYIVSVRGQFARHDELIRVPVTVLPVTFSLTKNTVGDVQVHNDAPYAVNVSGFSIDGSKSITFPENSFIPARGTITVAVEKIGSRLAKLHDATGVLLATSALPPVVTTEDAQPPSPIVATTRTTAPTIMPAAPDVPNFTFSPSSVTTDELPLVEEVVVATATTPALPTETAAAAAVQSGAALPEEWYPLFGLLGIILIGIAGAYFGAQKGIS